MRHSVLTNPMNPASTRTGRSSRYANTRDFALVGLFVFAFMLAGYLSLWMPLLALLRP
jgi:hypothetical protein